MVFGRTLVFISLIKLSVTINCDQRNVTNIETHLKLTLLCDYESYRLPGNFNTINLLVELDELYQLNYFLIGNLNLVINYTDTSLAFDPKNYDNITEIIVEIDDIWSPKLLFYDTLESKSSRHQCLTNCMIRFSGMVICKWSCYLKFACDSNLYNWPHVNQNCSFTMFTMNNYEKYLRFDTDISVEEKIDKSNWKLLSYEVFVPDINSSLFYPVFGVSILTEQDSYIEYFQTMYPIYSIFVITILAFALELDSLVRISMIAVSFYSELQLVESIGNSFFQRSDKLPIAVIYFRSFFITSGFLIVETMILRDLSRKMICAPKWFSHLDRLSKFFVFNFHLDSGLNKPNKILNLTADNLKWRLFCTILDRIFFMIWLIYITYMMSFK